MAALAFIQAPIEELLDKKKQQDDVPLLWLDDPYMTDPGFDGFGDAIGF